MDNQNNFINDDKIDQFLYSNKTANTTTDNIQNNNNNNTVPVGIYDPFNLLNINDNNGVNGTSPTTNNVAISSDTDIPTINTSVAPTTSNIADTIQNNFDDLNLFFDKESPLSPKIIHAPTLKIERSDTFEHNALLDTNDIIQSPSDNNNNNNNTLNTTKFLYPRTPTTNVFTNTFNNNLIASQNSNLHNNNNNNILTNTNLNICQNDSLLSTSPLHSPSYLSPSSYLSTNDTDNDDLLSVYSNNSYYSTSSSTSNVLLPINSHGLKHVNDLEDLDYLLENTCSNSYPLNNEYCDTGNHLSVAYDHKKYNSLDLNNTFNNEQYSAPIISIEEFNPIDNNNNNNNNTLFDLDPMTNQTCISNDNKNEEEHHNDTTRLNIVREEIIVGRKIRRKSITSNNNNNDKNNNSMKTLKPRSRSRSRRSSMSLDERARSLSENRDKLLKLADLRIDDIGTNTKTNSNSDSNKEFDHTMIPFPIKLEFNDNIPIPKNVNEINLNQNSKKKEEIAAKKNSRIYACSLCDKTFTRPYNLKSHLRTHTNERPFACTVCGKAFARQHDRRRHEDLHSGKKRYVCGGKLKNGQPWGCGKKFARSDALGRHFKTESGKKCIAPLYQEAAMERAAAILQQKQEQ